MKFQTPIVLFAIVCIVACTKEQNISSASYSGVSILTNPLPPPNDSVGATVTLTFSGNNFIGTSDTATSAITPVIGGGTYVIKSGQIIFTQKLFVNRMSDRSVLDGGYDLIKNGDSLVFARVPAAGLVGAGSIYFRLRAN